MHEDLKLSLTEELHYGLKAIGIDLSLLDPPKIPDPRVQLRTRIKMIRNGKDHRNAWNSYDRKRKVNPKTPKYLIKKCNGHLYFIE